ncbi:undecaprenyl-phosphate glucose phosphotransferase [Caballeronia sp. BR00000012568055]|uniref:undecaprenyl-phosphate glucose phosphotransferase n=1 Tax=Caballeronia sp. BR00000012568055 TaxID=2918761 RepID=UPI0023F698A2|nr:undecaprenyl-phosphate glucose phosphotransferase [Caballeronia sp. BR00000012568055]
MRLPRYSPLVAVPSGSDLIIRLFETTVAVTSAWAARRAFGADTMPAFDSAATAFALFVAWAVIFTRSEPRASRRPALCRDIAFPALGWVIAEVVGVWIVRCVHPSYAPSMPALLCWTGLTAAGIVACRLLERFACVRRARSCSVALVGRSDHCATLMRQIQATRGSLHRVGALFDIAGGCAPSCSDTPRFCDTDKFAAYVRAHDIDELWLALPLTDEPTLLRFLDIFRNDLLNIRFLPDVSRLTRFEHDASHFDNALAINLVASPLTADALAGKALFDRVFAACAVLATAPLLIAIALAVKLSSPGPVLFRQRRRGANGKPFGIYKFRTMREHASSGGTLAQATRNDPRVTRLGAFLRRTSLDELPQFFNVLCGDMSIVGPRPHAIEHDALYQDIVDDYIHRYRIKPGITGWAQINGLRGETDSIDKMQQRVEADLYYLSNWSFALDIRIVFATIVRGFVHRNAY